MRIVRLANFVTPTSGGLRTALYELGAGYAAAGHEPILIIPGPAARDEETPAGRVITVPGPTVPGLGGYRVIAGRRRLKRLLEELAPDRLEVSDRTTLRWTGAWARARNIRSIMVSHESLSALLRLYGPLGRLAGPLNRATAARFDTVVCTTAWAAAEFARLGVPNLVRAPLGVDLTSFGPERFDSGLRSRLAPQGQALLVHCGRLSPEKHPDRSIQALAELRRRDVPAVLVVAGDGPLRPKLARLAGNLPVRFLGHVADRDALAKLLATADLAIAPGPVETFGLASLEALASGTPVVASLHSALPEVIGPAGAAVDDDPAAYADAIEALLSKPGRRAVARAQAERYDWPAAVRAFLHAHDLTDTPARPS
ncbi:glycosyltransferase [Nonomuraea sp. CA-141351]|uniref:glycosyltransferase n=1 Tax=Nonomuraea sp. CA-141351 TaxID=3239996 RepID=UPI003D91B3E7